MKTPVVKVTPSVNVSVIHKLREVGIPASLKGYEYLKIAMDILLENPDQINYITKGVYPEISRLAGGEASPSRVERAIRHAIERAFDQLGADAIHKFFGFTPNQYSGKLSNSEFMAGLAELIRIEVGAYV